MSSDWADFANCADMPTTLFFDDSSRSYAENRRFQNEARRVCGECVVRGPCLEEALRLRIEHGIWGGLDEVERRRLVRQRNQNVA